MKNLHKAVKEYKRYKAIKDFNPTLCYNFLSGYYYVFYFYSKEFIIQICYLKLIDVYIQLNLNLNCIHLIELYSKY